MRKKILSLFFLIFVIFIIYLKFSSVDKEENHKKIIKFDVITGRASWYGPGFHGRQTTNQEIFDSLKLTAAHKTLPFNTLVRVINIRNKKSVVVRINDRGPFIKGRIIDLSYAAAKQISMIEDGVAFVRLEIPKKI